MELHTYHNQTLIFLTWTVFDIKSVRESENLKKHKRIDYKAYSRFHQAESTTMSDLYTSMPPLATVTVKPYTDGPKRIPTVE